MAIARPTFDDYVRIDLGGAQDPTHLMSHDWHTEDKGALEQTSAAATSATARGRSTSPPAGIA